MTGPRPFPTRGDLALAVVAVVAGVVLFGSLQRIWPLAALDLNVGEAALEHQAREFLERREFDLAGYVASTELLLDRPVLDYLESAFGRERTQAWIAEGLPVYLYQVELKRRGETVFYTVDLHPGLGVTGWRRLVEEDEPGPSLGVEEAREIARHAVVHGLGVDLGGWEEKGVATGVLPDRTDHRFSFERLLSEQPELRQRLFVTVAGDFAAYARSVLVVPREAAREARAGEAPGRVLEIVGFVLLAVAAFGGFFVFLLRLRDGTVRLGRAVFWPAVILVCLFGTYLLQTATLFGYWEPLWPRWVSTLQYLVYRSIGEVWMLLALLAVIAAGDALDRRSGAGRGRSLWALSRGKLLDAGVGAASIRGFLVGLVCGAVLVASTVVLETVAGARVSVQPRGFFFYAINSASPSAITLMFFLNVALLEELGYRFFAGTWLLGLTRRAWVAVLVPAAVYGLTHTRLDFLPPAEPFWGRALTMTLVGCVWGWAFLRYDALTVVLSHYTADLFIFNWPRLASGEAGPTTAALLTATVPLLPGVLWLVARALGRGGAAPPRPAQ